MWAPLGLVVGLVVGLAVGLVALSVVATTHFDNIGFSVDSREALTDLIQRTGRLGEAVEAPHGRYLRWSPGTGIELWAGVDEGMELLAFNPHFRGSGRMRARVERLQRDRQSPLQGSLFASLVDELEDDGVPLVVDVPDFDVVADSVQPPELVTLQVAGFAHEIDCFEDEPAFKAVETTFATRSFVPSGLFGAQAETARAEAMLTGVVLETSMLRNPETGAAFHALLIETLGGTLDVVAPPDALFGPPARGGVVRGQFWLSARVVDP